MKSKTTKNPHSKMRSYEVDVPVRVLIWTRPDCQRRQWEIIKKAAPSILFLISDGGRTPEEMEKIRESRQIVEDIDWECQVYRLYFEENQGMYGKAKPINDLIWSKVDRCIFLEDDYVPSVSYFRFCAELLEKYKDDDRIEMICGNNPFEIYRPAEPYDYFFTESGWSIWGTACWRRSIDNREFPLPYSNDEYVKQCLKDNLSGFWYEKVDDYCRGKLNDNHVPGGEYFHAINSVLYHRLSIVPTRNMINNIGTSGTHANVKKGDAASIYFNLNTYEITGDIKHPQYIIDDKKFGEMYSKHLKHYSKKSLKYKILRISHFVMLVVKGEAISALKRRLNRRIEK